MKKLSAIILALITVLALAGCGKAKKEFTVAVPNDPTNEARALLLLQANGLLKLKDGAGITATIQDIAETEASATQRTVSTSPRLHSTRMTSPQKAEAACSSSFITRAKAPSSHGHGV